MNKKVLKTKKCTYKKRGGKYEENNNVYNRINYF
jgi:hypothetical protein